MNKFSLTEQALDVNFLYLNFWIIYITCIIKIYLAPLFPFLPSAHSLISSFLLMEKFGRLSTLDIALYPNGYWGHWWKAWGLLSGVFAGQMFQCAICGYNNFVGRKSLPTFLALLLLDRAGNMAEAAFLVGFPNFALWLVARSCSLILWRQQEGLSTNCNFPLGYYSGAKDCQCSLD